jgi:hypothetical protein
MLRVAPTTTASRAIGTRAFSIAAQKLGQMVRV